MDLKNLSKILNNYPSYRLKQAKKAVFVDLIESWKDASVLPLDLRHKLDGGCSLEIRAELCKSLEKRSMKAVITLSDGLRIETVLMRHGDGRNTVCVSSQVGCPLACSFCLTGKTGFKRNLDVWEIVEQVLLWARLLGNKRTRISNIVFMGMGEPFLNYENVLGAIKILNDKDGFSLGARHFSISTAGVVKGIERLADEPLQINLAISLHAPNDELRTKLMPINDKYPIIKILDAVDGYIKKTRRRVMFEYIMIEGVNDSDELAYELAKITKRPLCFVNLISYNPTGGFRPSPPQKIKRFKGILEKEGVAVTQRYRFGDDIGAACGQLVCEE